MPLCGNPRKLLTRALDRERGVIAGAGFEGRRRHLTADSLPRPTRDDDRDAPPVLRGPAGVSCPVVQNDVTLAPASVIVGFGAKIADERLGAGLRQPPASPTRAQGRVPQRRVER